MPLICFLPLLNSFFSWCSLQCFFAAKVTQAGVTASVIGVDDAVRIHFAIADQCSLILETLRMAICERQPTPGSIHHSDRGTRYAWGDYLKELTDDGFLVSRSSRVIHMTMPIPRALLRPRSPMMFASGNTGP
jgi:hypothetical protein